MQTNGGSMLLKVVALVAALGLGGGYVWKRQEAAAARKEARQKEQAVMSGSKSAVLVGESKEVSREELDRMILLSGSKSGAVAIEDLKPEPDLPPSPDEEKTGERTILPGSKSFRVVPPEAPEEEP